MAQFSFLASGDATDLADDLREVFDELAQTLSHGQRAYSGEYRPALDVVETDTAVEVVMDVAGLTADAIRVVFRAGVLLVAGEKAQPAAGSARTFHLVEREFGRFARGIRLNGAFDVARSHGEVRDGELKIVLPKLVERRGQAHRIAVTAGESAGS